MKDIKMKVWNGEKLLGPFDLSVNNIYIEGFEDGERLLYVGIKDKNGKEIYENDILKGKYIMCGNERRFIGVVKFIHGSFVLFGIKKYKGIRNEIHSNYEIIGNVYYNHEMVGE